MLTKVLALFAIAGLVVLPGCNNREECCDDCGHGHHAHHGHHNMNHGHAHPHQGQHMQGNMQGQPMQGNMQGNMQGQSMQGNTQGNTNVNASMNTSSSANYYDNQANTYAEGTVSTIGADGRVVLRGYESPYATNYTSYHRDYYSIPENQRQTRATEVQARYKDKLTYSEHKDKERDYNFSISNPDRFTVYDESTRYGRGMESWNYSAPKTHRYSDIKQGDRVVIGYDSNNPSNVRSIYRVEAQKK